MSEQENTILHRMPQSISEGCSIVLYYSLLIIIPLYIYLGRNLYADIDSYGALGPAVFVILPFAAIYLAILCFISLTFAGLAFVRFWKFRRYKSLGLFALLIFISLSLPYMVDTRSKGAIHFFENRTQYEATIAAIKQSKTNIPHSTYSFKVEKQDPLVVTFAVGETSETTVYAEKREHLRWVSTCGGNQGFVHTQLADNWWTCFMDWN